MSYCRDIKPTLDTTLDADVKVDADGDEFSKFQLERNFITTVFITVLAGAVISLAAFYSNNCVRSHLTRIKRQTYSLSPLRECFWI